MDGIIWVFLAQVFAFVAMAAVVVLMRQVQSLTLRSGRLCPHCGTSAVR